MRVDGWMDGWCCCCEVCLLAFLTFRLVVMSRVDVVGSYRTIVTGRGSMMGV